MPMSVRNTVKFKLDLKNPLPLTDEQRNRLKASEAMPDEEIE